MYYPEELIEEVRQKNDIVDVLSGYVKLQKKGSSYFDYVHFIMISPRLFRLAEQEAVYYCFGV